MISTATGPGSLYLTGEEELTYEWYREAVYSRRRDSGTMHEGQQPRHSATMRDGRQVAPEANQCEPYRNTEPTKSDEAGPATYRNIPGTPPPEYAAYYP
jgi:hypothetical protein